MSTPVGRRSNLLLITLLLVISILLEQFFIAPIFPWLGNFGSVRPSIVFLDIPLQLPAIDLVPVSILFALFYQIAPSAGLSREHPSISSAARVWKALTGWWALLALLLAGGACFLLAQDYLPRSIGNGIDSFGIRADLTLPYPSGGLIHLHGSVVMLLTSALGIFILNRRTATPAQQPETAGAAILAPQPLPVTAPPPQPLSSSVVSSTGNLLMPTKEACPKDGHQPFAGNVLNSRKDISGTYSTSINDTFAAQKQQPRQQPQVAEVAVATATTPEKKYKPVTILPRNSSSNTAIITPEPPPTCRLTTPPPIAVVMPRPAPGIGRMHPCYVIGSLKPTKS